MGFSLGAFYDIACSITGIGNDGFSAGKLMGLTSYGDDSKYYEKLLQKYMYEECIVIDNNDFYIPKNYHNQMLPTWNVNGFYNYRNTWYNINLQNSEFQDKANFALWVQKEFERAIGLHPFFRS